MDNNSEKTGKEICQLKEKVEILEKVAVRLHIRLAVLEKKSKEDKDGKHGDEK